MQFYSATEKSLYNECIDLYWWIYNRKGLCKDNLNSVQRLKNTLRAFSFLTYLILMINQFAETQKS